MINPHYIRLHPDTFSEIQKEVFTTEEVLTENYKDSLEAKTPYYVYMYRHPVTNTVTYLVYSEKELLAELDVEKLNPKALTQIVKA